MVRPVASGAVGSPTDDPSPPERPAPAGESTRPAQAGESTVTEIRRDDGRLLLLYRWPRPADDPR